MDWALSALRGKPLQRDGVWASAISGGDSGPQAGLSCTSGTRKAAAGALVLFAKSLTEPSIHL